MGAPPSVPDESPLRRFGEAAALGTLAAIVASIPAALRASSADVSVVRAWLATIATVVLPAVALVALGRAARRALGGLVAENRAPVLPFVIAWVALALPLYVLLGTALAATTHNRALGGMTFGVLAIGIGVVAALVALRAVSLARSDRRSRRATAAIRVALLLCLLALATPVGRAIVATALGFSSLPPGVRAAIVDGAMALVAISLAVLLDPAPPLRRPLG